MESLKIIFIIILPKNMHNLPQVLLLSLLIVSGIAQSCATTPDPSLLLQTGTISIRNQMYYRRSIRESRYWSYDVAITYAVPPSGFQIAVSINGWLYGGRFPDKWDFSVRGGQGSSASSASIVVFILEEWTWDNLDVSYLISSRPDLILGSFIADGYIFQSTDSNQLTLNYAIPNWRSTTTEVISTTELAGIRTYLSQPLSLSIVSTIVNAQNGLLTIVIATNQPFELLYFTYFWWTTGAADISFSTFNVGDGTTLAYPFVGIDGIDGISQSKIIYAGSGFNKKKLISCSGTRCPEPCITSANCQALGGGVAGSTCAFCGANSQWNGTACACKTNYYLIEGACSQCQPNSAWSGSACVCLQPYKLVNGNCISCPANSVWVESQQVCACLSGYYRISGVCNTCPPNSGWNGTICVCLSGYYLLDKVCTQCPTNTIWNGTACVCQTGYYLVGGSCQLPPANTVYNGTGFACIAKYYLINGVCSQCPAKSSWNGSSCVCNAKFYLIGGVCIQCEARSTYNGSACVCDNGFYLINNVCSQCQKNSNWNGTACVCLIGFYPSGKNCLPCGANSAWDGSTCACNSGYFLINNVCTPCAANQIWNGSSCICALNYYLIGGVCQLCPSNAFWNGTACVPICPTKSAWNGNTCACLTGFFQIQGTCLPCDPNSSYNGQTCICYPGYFGNYQLCTACHSSCATCSQSGPYGCSSCPSGITLNQGACVVGCGTGKVLQNTACVNCPSSCISCSDADTCTTCAQNYTLLQQIINGKSVVGCTLPGPPTPGSKLALTGIVVGNNVIYQGLTLTTLPAYFLANNCADCSDLFTVLIIPNNLGITYTVQYVLYSQYWFIINFSYGSSGITPYFQFKIQLNFKYASYFTSADMAQGLFSSVDPAEYPSTPAPTPNNNIQPAPRPRVFSTSSPTADPIVNPIANPEVIPNPNLASPERAVMANGVLSTVNAPTLVTLFS